MPANDCTANTSRRHRYTFTSTGATTLANRVATLSFSMKSVTNYAKDEGVNGLLHGRNEYYVIEKNAVIALVSSNVRSADMVWCMPLVLGTTFTGQIIESCKHGQDGEWDGFHGRGHA